MSYINNKNLDSYYVDFYKQELIGNPEDSKDNIVMVSHGTFKKDCERNNFPWATLRQAQNGKKLYISRDGTVSKNMLESSRKFIGWYIVCK